MPHSIHRQQVEATRFETLLNAYPADEFASPSRSTVPLLAYFKPAEQRLRELSSLLGLPLGEEATLTFESTLDVQGGRGRPSQTDLLITTEDHTIAVEAKYTEPHYETVAQWLNVPSAENRRLVLDGWLNVIRKATGRKSLSAKDVSECTYQMVHRTASACFPRDLESAVVYLCFSTTQEIQQGYQKRLSRLSDIIGGGLLTVEFLLITINIKPKPQYEDLQKAWQDGNRDLSSAVKQGLRNDTLMDFDTPFLTRC